MITKKQVQDAVMTLESRGEPVTVRSVRAITGGGNQRVCQFLAEVQTEAPAPDPNDPHTLLTTLLGPYEAPEWGPDHKPDRNDPMIWQRAWQREIEKVWEAQARIDELEQTQFQAKNNVRIIPLNQQEPFFERDTLVSPPRAKMTIFLDPEDDREDKKWHHVSDVVLNLQALAEVQNYVRDMDSRHHHALQTLVARMTLPPE